MAIPLLAALAASAAPGLINSGLKFFAGNKQIKKGEAIDKANKFTEYKRPSEVDQALKLSENNYLSGMPGVDILSNRIGTNSATALNTAREGASSSADVLDAATKIGSAANTADQNLTLQEAQYQEQALANLQNQLGNSANYADKEFQYNIADPYARKAAAASALIGAGNTNKYNAIDEGLGIATDALRAGLLPKSGNGQIPSSPIPLPSTTASGGNTPFKGFANPAIMGKWVFDQSTGKKRLIAN